MLGQAKPEWSKSVFPLFRCFSLTKTPWIIIFFYLGCVYIHVWGKEGDRWVLKDVLDDAHERTIRRVSFSPNGKYLVSASFDASCKVWELRDGSFKRLAVLEGHENEVKGAAFDSSGSLIATCSRDKSVWIWEMESEREFVCLSVLSGHTQDVKNVVWHPSQELLVSCSYDDTLKVWLDDEDDWFCSETLSAHKSTVWDAAFERSEGRLLASCCDDGSVIVWEYTTPARKPSSFDAEGQTKCFQQLTNMAGVHPRSVYAVDWTQGNVLATACADDAVRVIAFDREAKTFNLKGTKSKAHSADVNCVRWCPTDPTLLASAGDDNTVKLWRVKL
eukprot:TRINITY_DN3888_c0_g1_i1.p1 TRINITY_DN3888_c0_g1~~TRINITY_DN3888_c0_g1_i1.p1  ORF type:complete len:332 (+),score=39.18 TRINITY_DN3888_c0_g1_i1:183-1178(+)